MKLSSVKADVLKCEKIAFHLPCVCGQNGSNYWHKCYLVTWLGMAQCNFFILQHKLNSNEDKLKHMDEQQCECSV